MERLINRVPSNELYNRIQKNPLTKKEFKKSILNLYKQHPVVAEKVVDILDDVWKNHWISEEYSATYSNAYYRTKEEINSKEYIFDDIRSSCKDIIENARQALVIVLNLQKELSSYRFTYYLFEMNDGSIVQYYHK